MKQLFLSITLILSSIIFLSAQGEEEYILKGQMLDKDTEEPLMFATLAIQGYSRGTSTDVFGTFEFKILDKYKNDTLDFRLLGYTPKKIAISDIWGGEDELMIKLESTAFKMDDIVVEGKIILYNIEFEFGKHTLLESSYPELEKVYKYLSNNEDIEVEISGHTDSIGSAEYNEGLSAARAGAVVAWLEERGIDQARMTSVGYGESQPLTWNDTEEQRLKNRRVEFKIIRQGQDTLLLDEEMLVSVPNNKRDSTALDSTKIVNVETETPDKPDGKKPKENIRKNGDSKTNPNALFPEKEKKAETGVITRIELSEEEEVFTRKAGTIDHFVDSIVNAYTLKDRFNGAIMVGDASRVHYQAALGDANKTWEVPLSFKTKFKIGAMSEQFTALLVFRLMEEGKINATKPINTYLKDLQLVRGHQLTVEHLLSHSSGFTNDLKVIPTETEGVWNHKAVVAHINNKSLAGTPGKVYLYSRINYYLLGLIVEQVTDEDLSTLLQEDILNPLELSSVEMIDPKKIDKNRAAGYQKSGEEFVNTTTETGVWGADNLVANISDIYKWNIALEKDETMKKYMRIFAKSDIRKVENGSFKFDGRIGMSFEEGYGCFSNGEGYQGLLTNLNGYTVLMLSNVENGGLEKIQKDIFKILY